MRKYTFPCVLIALLIGAFLRIWQITLYPPGLHFDPASNIVLMSEIAFKGARPIFYSSWSGREVLFFYLGAGMFRLLGASIFSLHLTSIFTGILTLAAGYFAIRQFWLAMAIPSPKHFSHWLATFALLFWAYNLTHILWSRYGLRLISMPLLLSLSAGYFFRAVRTQRGQDWLISGIFTGLTAHTYISARVYPLVLGWLWLGLFWQSWRGTGQVSLTTRVRQFFYFAVPALLIVLPLGWYFYQHPSDFFNRANQLAANGNSENPTAWRVITATLGMFFVYGEPYSRFNLPGKPWLGPLAGAFFLIGVLASVWYIANPQGKRQRWGLLSLWVWIIIFLIPMMLAVRDLLPSHFRSFGIMPMVFLLPAWGVLLVWQLLSQQITRLQAHTTLPALFGILALAGSINTYYEHFFLWARQPDLHGANDGQFRSASEYLNTLTLEPAEEVYLAAYQYRHPAVAVLARDYGRLRWLIRAEALVLPRPNHPVRYIFPQSDLPPAEWIVGWEPFLTANPKEPKGAVDFWAYRFENAAQVPVPTLTPTHFSFGGQVALTGWQIQREANHQLVSDYWLEITAPPEHLDYRLVVDLVDEQGNPITQSYNDAYLGEQWQIGEQILARITHHLPPSLPAGNYYLQATIFSPSAQQNLPAITPTQQTAAYARLGAFSLHGSDAFWQTLHPQVTLQQPVESALLLGYDLPNSTLRAGDWLNMKLYWQSGTAPLAGQLRWAGETLAKLEVPAQASAPNHLHTLHLQMPKSRPSGTFPLQLQVGTTVIDLAALTLQTVPHTFSAQPLANRVQADFGAFLLDSWQISHQQLQILWHCQAETTQSWTTFVHLLDANGNILAQQDLPPQAGAYPTHLWVAGEWVQDPYSFQIDWQMVKSWRVGWYDPLSGERLRLADGSDAVVISLESANPP